MGCKLKSGKSMYRVFISVSLAAWMVVSAAGCYLDKEEILYPGSNLPADCAITPSKFAADVQPLIISKCALPGCHDATGASGGVILQTFEQVNAKKDRVNNRAVLEKTMPPTGALLPAEAAKIKCWLDGGALNN